MKPRLYALAIIAASSTLTAPAHAEDECTKLIIYAIKQFCSLLPNGQSLCQPVALTGPSPACEVPPGTQLKPVPLAPPRVQMPQPYPYTPPFGQTPFAPAPFAPYTPFPPVAFPQGPLPGYTPQQFTMPQFAMPQLAMPQFAMPTPPAPAAPSTAPVAAKPAAAPEPKPAAEPAATATLVPAEAEKAPPAPAPSIAAPASEAATKPAAPVSESAAPAPVPSVTPVATPVEAPPVPQAAAEARPAESSASGSVVVEDALAHFAFDSAELTQAGRDTLDAWLAHAPVGMPVTVSGYADRLGPEPYNLKLSQQRADAARNYLISKGKDARDIRTIARGEADPVTRCKGGPTPTTKKCLAPNRRVEIKPE